MTRKRVVLLALWGALLVGATAVRPVISTAGPAALVTADSVPLLGGSEWG